MGRTEKTYRMFLERISRRVLTKEVDPLDHSSDDVTREVRRGGIETLARAPFPLPLKVSLPSSLWMEPIYRTYRCLVTVSPIHPTL